tara:strand:+ start:731 stop:1066 length:336 start_codon:yes stop_codon:yes gene_type:complete
MGMERYTAFIASTDDFRGTADELVSEWQDEHPAVYHIDFEVPKGTSSRLITLIARGLFWEDQWTSDGTISTVVKDLTPEDTRPLGDDRTEVRKTGSVKDIDLWNPNDPTNW